MIQQGEFYTGTATNPGRPHRGSTSKIGALSKALLLGFADRSIHVRGHDEQLSLLLDCHSGNSAAHRDKRRERNVSKQKWNLC
jgi:hypothetical protein